jgi:hypothetical protein
VRALGSRRPDDQSGSPTASNGLEKGSMTYLAVNAVRMYYETRSSASSRTADTALCPQRRC